MGPRAGEVVERIVRHEALVAVAADTFAHQAETMEDEPSGDLDRREIEQARQVVEAVVVVEPGWKGAGGRPLRVRVHLAPGGVDAEDQRLRLRHDPQEERGELHLLPGRAGVEPEIGEVRAEARVEQGRIEETHRRGAEHRRVEAAAAHDLRIHEALVQIHDRGGRGARGRARPIGIEREDEGGEARRHGKCREREARREGTPREAE